jgi:hypothetical protein
MIQKTFFMALGSESHADAAPNTELGFETRMHDFGLGGKTGRYL